MDTLTPIFIAGVTGLISGLLLSIPVGPINLTILNEGARRGFKWGLLIGMGATLMETIYCFIAFTGLASFFTRGYVKIIMELCSFGFILFLGIKFLCAKSCEPPMRLGKAVDRFETRLGERFHPHSAFMTGFVRVMGNVGVLVFWVILAANFIYREWVTPDWAGKCACVGGVTLGTGSWFVFLAWIASKGRGKFSEKTLLRIEHISGFVLLGVALVHGVTIIREIHKKDKVTQNLPALELPLASKAFTERSLTRQNQPLC
jgi:threonine/homoserine/homoserine lactone efflux protein